MTHESVENLRISRIRAANMPSNGIIEFGNRGYSDSSEDVERSTAKKAANGYQILPMQDRFYGSVSDPNEIEDIAQVEKMESLPPSSFASTSIIVLCVLVGDMARGLLFPSLWLLVQSVGGSKVYQGMAVSAFSAGRIISSPIFGWLSEQFGYKHVLMACNLIMFIGCYVYSISASVSGVILGQFIIGFGAGSLGVTRSYVAEKTHRSERTLYMAYMTAVQYAGFTMTPILGAILSAWAYEHESSNTVFKFNQYTFPTFFLMGVCVVATLLLHAVFVDVVRGPSALKASSDIDDSLSRNGHALPAAEPELAEEEAAVGDRWCGWSVSDRVALGGCLLNVTTKGTIGVFETLGLFYMSSHYHWSSLRAGLTVTVSGTLGVISLLLFSVLLQHFRDVDLVLYGMVTMTLASFMLSFAVVPEWQFYVVIVMTYSLGYPIGHTALLGVFSKIMKSGPQGKLLGYFGSAGSLARVLFPLLAGVLTEFWSERAIFLLMACLLLLSCAAFVRFRQTISDVIS